MIIPDGTKVVALGISREMEGVVEHSYETPRGRIYVVEFDRAFIVSVADRQFWDGRGLCFHEQFVRRMPAEPEIVN